jgi:hypothetical protein
MDTTVILNNIDRLLRTKKVSQNAISAKAKRPDAIRNLRRGSSWTLEILHDIAKALDVPAWELMRPPGAVPKDQEFREFVREMIDEQIADAVIAPRKRKMR